MKELSNQLGVTLTNKLRERILWLALATGLLVTGCGGGGSDLSQADRSDAAVVGNTAGASPFITFVQLKGNSLQQVASVGYAIAAKPGAASAPVRVHYTVDALRRKGYFPAGSSELTMPVFGLYANYGNQVTVDLHYTDGSTAALVATIATQPYTDPNGIYDKPTVHTPRAAGSKLGFDFFAIKNVYGAPVVIDTDGEIRWALPGTPNGNSTMLKDNGFVLGDQYGPDFYRIEFDGSSSKTYLASTTITQFHHNLDAGKFGVIGEFSQTVGGVLYDKSYAADFDATGALLGQWDFAALLSNYMSSQGDDPTPFVRPSSDWFHMNAMIYDPRDDSVIASSRENFVIKVDYRTGAIVWIFGDPTKYWHTFPSLRAKALALIGSDFYPIGQHAISITSDGLLLLFNDGQGSTGQPAGAPNGTTRTYSAVSAYSIDPIGKSAHEAWRFDNGQTLFSPYCSSAYQQPDKSLIVNYSVLDGGTDARVIGLNPSHEVVFDFQYASPGTCLSAWNTITVPFEDMIFQ